MKKKMPVFKHLQTWKLQFIGEDACSIKLLGTPTEDLQFSHGKTFP